MTDWTPIVISVVGSAVTAVLGAGLHTIKTITSRLESIENKANGRLQAIEGKLEILIRLEERAASLERRLDGMEIPLRDYPVVTKFGRVAEQ